MEQAAAKIVKSGADGAAARATAAVLAAGRSGERLARAGDRAATIAAAGATAHSTPAAAASDEDSCPFTRILLPELLQRIAAFLPRNEVACSLRLVCKAAAAALAGPGYTTVRLSEPSPPAAFAQQWSGPDALRSLTRKQREQLELLTARSGSITNIQALAARGDLPILSSCSSCWGPLIKAAAHAGRLELCGWLLVMQQATPALQGYIDAAAGAGELTVVQFFAFAQPDRELSLAVSAAARHGRVQVLDWLLGQMEPKTVDAGLLEKVAHGCTLDVLQRMHGRYAGQRPEEDPTLVLTHCLPSAAGSPTPDWREKVEWLEAAGGVRESDSCLRAAEQPDGVARLQWLAGRGYVLNEHAAAAAAGAGNGEALQHILAQGIEMRATYAAYAMRLAVQRGHLAAAKVLHAHGAAILPADVDLAVQGGHLPVVAWAAEQLGAGLELTADLFRTAARSGSWPLMRWLHERGCPWDATVVAAAVAHCGGEQLQWLVERRCPWDATVFAAAAVACSEEQLQWLVERGCPMGEDGEAYASAMGVRDVMVLRCLRRLGCPFAPNGATFTAAVRRLKWYSSDAGRFLALLLDAGCPVDWDAAIEAAVEYPVWKSWLAYERQQRGHQ